ncbi:hypothetical protein SAMN06265367_106184 [Algoriphagus winogradskyi]|uniref:Uncharacterized protein n=1 Tax=Algoriphagus winogradskyi TaxID=237017 RepID=A0ABY1PA55_9BACT|nr:hypothetical protein SAMN06265367_106184 [Algoriphagus winogradskyi]
MFLAMGQLVGQANYTQCHERSNYAERGRLILHYDYFNDQILFPIFEVQMKKD